MLMPDGSGEALFSSALTQVEQGIMNDFRFKNNHARDMKVHTPEESLCIFKKARTREEKVDCSRVAYLRNSGAREFSKISNLRAARSREFARD